MVEDDIAIQSVLICCKIFRRPRHKIGPCRTFVSKYISSGVNFRVTLIHYPNYDILPSNSLEDIKQNHWTAKYMSLTYIYFMRSIFVTH